MKIYYRHWKLLTLTLMIFLISIGYVLAPSIVPIGYTGQAVPFESSPAAKITSSRTITNDIRGNDKDTDSYFKMSYSSGYWGLTQFGKPSDFLMTDFAIGWVDIKVKYSSTGSSDDKYRIEYTVGSAAWVAGNLQPDISGTPAAVYPASADTLARVWHNVAELETPGDGWTWTDIYNLKVRFVTTQTGTLDSSLTYYVLVYEIWVSVYPLPLPPSASTAVSIQPAVTPTLPYEDNPDTDPVENLFFVDIYVKDVANVAGWQINLDFNTTVLSAVQGMVYAPWTYVGWIDLEVIPGTVSIASVIDTTNPLVDVGWSGSSPLGRIYFTVDAPGWSWLMPTLTKVSAPSPTGPVPISHSQYPGVYGTPPSNMYLFSGGTDLTDPVSTMWTKIFPEPKEPGWHLSSWQDTSVPPDGKLSVSDTIDMTPPGATEKRWFHVDSLWTSEASGVVKHYIDCTERPPPVPEFPLGIGIIMVLAPLIPIVYLWRKRPKRRV